MTTGKLHWSVRHRLRSRGLGRKLSLAEGCVISMRQSASARAGRGKNITMLPKIGQIGTSRKTAKSDGFLNPVLTEWYFYERLSFCAESYEVLSSRKKKQRNLPTKRGGGIRTKS